MIIDPKTGLPIDVNAGVAFVQGSLSHAKTQKLEQLARAGHIKFNAALAERSFTGDCVTKQFGADAAGNFTVARTEFFDPFINAPLFTSEVEKNITIEQVALGIEGTSFVNSKVFGSASKDKQGIAWAAAQETNLPQVDAEFAKTFVSVAGWARQVHFDVFEVARAQMNGIALETVKLDALGTQWSLDTNVVAHLGSYAYGGYGLFNRTEVTPLTASTKTAGGTRWVINGALNATPQEILADIRALETKMRTQSDYALVGSELRLDPITYAALTAPLSVVGMAGATSILQYLADNSICRSMTGKPLNIVDSRFLLGTTAATEAGVTVAFNATGSDQASAGAACRAALYINERQYCRMKTTNPFALQVQYVGTNYQIPYIGQLPAGIEAPYSSKSFAYMDGV